jgi:hypothetical protein
MTKASACATVVIGLAISRGVVAQTLRGSDTLEDVVATAVAITTGGGSGAGESAMMPGFTPTPQQIAPMSRHLNDTSVVGGALVPNCGAAPNQLQLVGLDGISVVASDPGGGDSLSETGTSQCSDSISMKALTGITEADNATPCGTNDGCSTPGTYSFTSWADVLAMVYGGLNHNAAAGPPIFVAASGVCTYQPPPNEAAADGACPAGLVCFPNNQCGDPTVVGHRNPARVNCLNPVRLKLVNTYGNVFSDVSPVNTCRSGGCIKLKRAFRMDDLSGTSDVFATLVGLPRIPPFTKAPITGSPFLPLADRQATANPFCNGGERVMNRGDADYLDLDPIRRAVDLEVDGVNNRFGLEQVGQLVPAYGGNNNDVRCMPDHDLATPGLQPPIPADDSSPNEPGILPDPNIPGSTALLQAELGSNGAGGLLAAPFAASTRLCLGLVLPISVPSNYATPQQAYFADASSTTVECDLVDGTSSAFSYVIPETTHPATALCPNGTHQPCLMPYKVDTSMASGKNFNCLSRQLNPLPPGVADRRVFNLHPVDVNGHYLRDSYVNGFLPTALSPVRQGRVVTAFYRLHTNRTTNLGGGLPTGGPCTNLTSTTQIGCLVKANPCSIGFAGREAADRTAVTFPPANMAFMLDGIQPSNPNIQSLLIGGAPLYPMARPLWITAIGGFAVVGPSPTTAAVLALTFPAPTPPFVAQIVADNYVTVPPAFGPLLWSCPSPFGY